MRYFKKRPDLIMDFYFVLSERLLYDKYSYKYKYNHETRLIDKLWCYTEKGKNYNNSILYLQISESALKTELSFTEGVKNSRAINFVKMTIGFAEEIANMRTRIWKNLAVLRKNEEYRHAIDDILLNVHLNGLNEEDSKKYLQSDFNAVYEYVIDKNTPNFIDAKVVERYKVKAERLGIKLDRRFMIAERNTEFRIYKMLRREHLIGRTLDEDAQFQKESISKEISEYDLKDFHELFRVCKFLENTVYDREKWSISAGLDCVFEIIEDDSELYLQVLEEYLKVNVPFSLNGYHQIKYMIDHIGYEDTYYFVNNYAFNKKDTWLSLICECVPEDNISEKIINDYKSFVLNNLEKDNPIAPAIQVVTRYGERDSELKIEVIKAIMANLELSASFLNYVYQDESIERILNFFRNDIDALASIYINALKVGYHFDYDGKLFTKIFDQQPAIWNEYVNWVKSKDNIYGELNEKEIFELIWNVDKWRECVEYAFKVLVDDDKIFYIKNPVILLFAKAIDTTMFERKKSWLIEKLGENSLNIERCKNLIDVVVNVLPDWKLIYILEFLKANKNLEDFKKIHLFPSSCSWSGSEIPLIIEKIDFLRLLKENLQGIDYIDHREYLEDYCMKLEKYKEKVEIREYLENADYA